MNDRTCPADRLRAASLESAVIADAHRTHPHRRVDGEYRSSPHYLDSDVMAALSEHLPAAPAAAEAWGFHREDVAMLRRRVADRARRGGLGESGVQDLVWAVGEAISNTLDHIRGPGTLHTWWDTDTPVCEVADRGQIADRAMGRVAPQAQADRAVACGSSTGSVTWLNFIPARRIPASACTCGSPPRRSKRCRADASRLGARSQVTAPTPRPGGHR